MFAVITDLRFSCNIYLCIFDDIIFVFVVISKMIVAKTDGTHQDKHKTKQKKL